MRRKLWQRLVIWSRLFFVGHDHPDSSVTGRVNGRPWVDELKVDNDYGGGDLPIPFHGGDITVSYNTAPVIVDPDHILYSGSAAVVPEVPLDGIERLRKRLGRQPVIHDADLWDHGTATYEDTER